MQHALATAAEEQLCTRHFKRLLRHGDPLGGGRYRDPGQRCELADCDRKHYSQGYCKSHYGSLIDRPRHANAPGSATVEQIRARIDFYGGRCFVALGEGESFRLDAVQLGINDELAAHHIYSFKELDALQHGGVQRIYMGNLPKGSHDLEVSVLGKLANGEDFNRAERFTFRKGIDPSLLGITLAPDSGEVSIELQDW